MGACDPLAVPRSSLQDSPALRKSCDEPAAWAAHVQVSSPRAACVQVSSPRPAKPTGLGCSGHRAPRLPDLRGEGRLGSPGAGRAASGKASSSHLPLKLAQTVFELRKEISRTRSYRPGTVPRSHLLTPRVKRNVTT